MLELRQLWQSVGSEPLFSGVNLAVPRGEPTCLIGLSPAGRARLVRLLTGQTRPRRGFIRLDGEDVSRQRRRGRVLRVGAEGYLRRAGAVSRVVGEACAARVGLEKHLAEPTHLLNPEQRVRLALAVALETKPALLLLDAPAARLGSESRVRLATDLGAMTADVEGVVLLAAGGPDEALGLGGHTVIVSGGFIQQSGSHGELISQPVSLTAARALAWPALNCLPMRLEAGRVRLDDGAILHLPESVALPSAGRGVLAFHPAASRLERESSDCIRFVSRARGEHVVADRIYERVSFAGSDWLAPRRAAPPEQGALLNIFVDASSLYVFDAEGLLIRQHAACHNPITDAAS